MGLICRNCGRDLDKLWQENASWIPGIVLCEDCAVFKDIGSQIYEPDGFPHENDENDISA